MRLVIVTGMSGAGKSTALKVLEDAHYFCVDNLPVPLMEKFTALMSEIRDVHTAAIGIDSRSGSSLRQLEEVLERLRREGNSCEILFLDAEDSVLVKRYKETRRSHPLAASSRVAEGIALERSQMASLRSRADYIIDTSHLLARELKEEVERIFVDHGEFRNLVISILSFGFKYGIPTDADLVFDVRFLPNPYYVDSLRPQTGLDRDVYQYVMSSAASEEFAGKLLDMVQFLIPLYVREGKTSLVIAIGCTGGKHRSVALSRVLYEKLAGDRSYVLRLEHRDIGKDAARS